MLPSISCILLSIESSNATDDRIFWLASIKSLGLMFVIFMFIADNSSIAFNTDKPVISAIVMFKFWCCSSGKLFLSVSIISWDFSILASILTLSLTGKNSNSSAKPLSWPISFVVNALNSPDFLSLIIRSSTLPVKNFAFRFLSDQTLAPSGSIDQESNPSISCATLNVTLEAAFFTFLCIVGSSIAPANSPPIAKPSLPVILNNVPPIADAYASFLTRAFV